MTLEPITPEGKPVWKEMREALFTDCSPEFNEEEMELILQRQDRFCFFVKNDFRIIGMVELSARNVVDGCLGSPVAYLEALYLTPAFRGQGIGSEILQRLIQWCQKHGFKELATDTEQDNHVAKKFYTAFGFEELETITTFRINIHKV